MLTGSKRKAMKMPGPRKTKPRKAKCRHRIVVRTWGELAGQVLSKRCSLSSGCGAPLSLGPSNDDIPLDEIAHATFAKDDGYWSGFDDPDGYDWDVSRPLREQWPWGPADPEHMARGDAQLDEVIESTEARLDRLQAETASAMAALFAGVAVPDRETAPDAFAPVDTASREPWCADGETQLSEACDAAVDALDRADTKLRASVDAFAELVTVVPDGAA